MTRPIVKLREEMSTGIWPGSNFQKIPMWRRGSNVRFSPDGPRKMEGWSDTNLGLLLPDPSTDPVRGIHQVQSYSTGFRIAYAGTLASLWDSSELSSFAQDATGFNGNLNASGSTPATQWSFVNYGTQTFATNGVDYPQERFGSSFQNLTNQSQFSSAEIVRVLGPHVLFFNTSINALGFIWCDTDNPAEWQLTVANAAGDLILREANTQIVAAENIGDKIMVYTSDDTYLVNYIGAPDYFGYRPAIEGIGAVSKNSIVPVDKQHFGWGPMGFFVTDGISSRRIDNPMVKSFIDVDASVAQRSKVCAYHDEVKRSIIWYYQSSSGTDVDSGIAYDYEKGLWWLLGHGRSACDERRNFDWALTVDPTDSRVYWENFGVDAAGSGMEAWVRTKPLDGDVADLIKEIEAIRIAYVGFDLQFRLGWSDTEGGTIQWGPYQMVEDGFELNYYDINGRYITLELYSNSLSDQWNVGGIDVHGRVGGER